MQAQAQQQDSETDELGLEDGDEAAVDEGVDGAIRRFAAQHVGQALGRRRRMIDEQPEARRGEDEKGHAGRAARRSALSLFSVMFAEGRCEGMPGAPLPRRMAASAAASISGLDRRRRRRVARDADIGLAALRRGQRVLSAGRLQQAALLDE